MDQIRCAMLLGLLAGGFCQGVSGAEVKAAELFRMTNVWTAKLKVSAEQWEAIEPKGGGGGFFGRPPGGPGGGPGPRGPGGPGGDVVRPFGPSMILAPVFMRDGDANSDGKLSREEFGKLGEKWFGQWDKAAGGKVNEEQLRDGLNAMLAPPGGGPGGGGPRMGGPGPGFRMNLQGAEGKRNGVAAMAGIEFEYVKGDLEFAGKALTNIAVRYKGNGTFMASRESEKKSLKVDLNDFVKGQKLAGRTKLNFHNCVTDGSWMNEVLSHKLFRDAGVPAPRTAYAKMLVTVPGKYEEKYFGLYSLVENVDEDFADAFFDTKKGGIFKPVTPDLFNDLGEDWAKYNQTYDPKGDVTPAHKQRMIELCKLVTNGTNEEFNRKIGEYIDLDKFSRYMAVLVFLADLDGILGPGQNFYLHLHPTTGKIAFIPWDMDNSFGQFAMRGTQEQRENLSIDKPWQGENHFLERIYKNEEFRKLYRARIEEFSESIFKPERFHAQVNEIAEAIRAAVAEEGEEKLARFDSAVAGKPMEPGLFGRGPRGGGPDFARFMPQTKPIKPFVTIRAQSIKEQLAGKPGQTLAEFGFGPPGGGPGGPPRGFGPGTFLAGTFMAALDADKNGEIARAEARAAFARLFPIWNKSGSGELSDDELRVGLDNDFAPRIGGPGFPPPSAPR